MARLAFANDPLLPRPPGGLGLGAVLAVAAHVGLLAALTLGVQWRTQKPDLVVAELWATVPQSAAPLPAPAPPPTALAAPTPAPATPPPAPPPKPVPAAPAPPPPPPTRDADIATERRGREQAAKAAETAEAAAKARAEAARKLQETKLAQQKQQEEEAQRQRLAAREREREVAEQRRRDEAERKAAADAKAKADEERLAKQREENLRRIMGQAAAGSETPPNPQTTAAANAPPANPSSTSGSGSSLKPGTAAQSAAPSADYAGRLIALIRPNIVFTGAVNSVAAAEVEVRTAAGGSVLSRRLLKSSGNKDWDEAVLRAIDRTVSLPRDTDGRVPSSLTLVFRPRE
jgi:colicin import membrane protein